MFESQKPPTSSEPSGASGREVLVVEDGVRMRAMLSEALHGMDYRPKLVPTAEAASRELGQNRYDILILDLNLPGMDGIEFLEMVRGRQDDIQVIILTGYGDLEAARRAIHLDVVEFLTKPCTLDKLEAALERAWARRKGQIINESASVARRAETVPRTPRPVPAAPPSDAAMKPGSLEDLERQHILSVLEQCGGNRAAAARELGISLRKLYYRLGEYQHRPEQGQRSSVS